MKIKSSFRGKSCDIPQIIKKSFELNDRYHNATIVLDFLGNYSINPHCSK